MTAKQTSVDINEAFEQLLFAEEHAQNSAYDVGYEVGKTRLVNGYHLGYHRASVVAAQLGYYSGILEQYLHHREKSPNKGTSIARELLSEINNFPRDNDDETFDILKKLEEIKSKYARFCSFAKISPTYPEAEKLDF